MNKIKELVLENIESQLSRGTVDYKELLQCVEISYINNSLDMCIYRVIKDSNEQEKQKFIFSIRSSIEKEITECSIFTTLLQMNLITNFEV